MQTTKPKVALITGAVQRIGASIARQLHATGMNVALHYRHSKTAANALQAELNAQRSNSVMLLQGDLHHIERLKDMVEEVVSYYHRLDVLINNASSFYPTPIGQVGEKEWDDLLGTNLKAPFFLSQAAAPYLMKYQGCIVNLVDIHGERPMKSHPVYSTAKAGLIMLTKTLARELGPDIRVNAVAPGAILWPDNGMNEETKQRIL
ncbi:MAG: pteridine reductase, partial [Thiomargarita sp.]|nr:pteridine reductase [Thiomargarita sp.]